MNSKFFTTKFLTISTMIIVAAIMRLVPHWPNFTPIAAMAIFGGVYFSKKHQAFIVPILALLLSDLFLGFHNYMISVYFSFVLIVMLSFLIRNNHKIHNVIGITLTSATLFYLITNFAVWFGSPFYNQSFSGLLTCYLAGLPFYGFQLMGDLFYTGILFGSYALISSKIPSLIKN